MAMRDTRALTPLARGWKQQWLYGKGERKCHLVVKAGDWAPGDLGSAPTSAAGSLGDLGQVTSFSVLWFTHLCDGDTDNELPPKGSMSHCLQSALSPRVGASREETQGPSVPCCKGPR